MVSCCSFCFLAFFHADTQHRVSLLGQREKERSTERERGSERERERYTHRESEREEGKQ
jgi:hypothetical protein